MLLLQCTTYVVNEMFIANVLRPYFVAIVDIATAAVVAVDSLES